MTDRTEVILQQIADAAVQVLPEGWDLIPDRMITVDMVRTHDGGMASDSEPSAHSVEAGYYLNGVQQTPPDAPSEDEKIADVSFSDTLQGSGIGQWAELGNNTSVNAAMVVDLGESGRSMIVMGDYYSTDAIFQVNAAWDVTLAGLPLNFPSGQPAAVNENIAEFVQRAGVYDGRPSLFAGPNWQVDVVHGDYYSVNALIQLNHLLDNDVVVQRSAESHYELYVGGNTLVNLAQVFDGRIHYDLIVVEGAYHGMNVIYQNNFLLNDDHIRQISGGAGSSQTITSSGNELTSSAAIENYGGNSFMPVNAELNGLVVALGAGQTTLDPSYGNLLDGSGGTFNVLYVRGDYYDINAVYQTNVTADLNVIVQMLDTPSAGARALNADGATIQHTSSDGNELSNYAAIFDVDATETYVNGDVYGDTILVQADLLPDRDQFLNAGIQELVSEIIAFVTQDVGENAAAPMMVMSPAPHDPIASLTY